MPKDMKKVRASDHVSFSMVCGLRLNQMLLLGAALLWRLCHFLTRLGMVRLQSGDVSYVEAVQNTTSSAPQRKSRESSVGK